MPVRVFSENSGDKSITLCEVSKLRSREGIAPDRYFGKWSQTTEVSASSAHGANRQCLF